MLNTLFYDCRLSCTGLIFHFSMFEIFFLINATKLIPVCTQEVQGNSLCLGQNMKHTSGKCMSIEIEIVVKEENIKSSVNTLITMKSPFIIYSY